MQLALIGQVDWSPVKIDMREALTLFYLSPVAASLKSCDHVLGKVARSHNKVVIMSLDVHSFAQEELELKV